MFLHLLLMAVTCFAAAFDQDGILLTNAVSPRELTISSLSFPMTFGNPWLTKRILLYKLMSMRKLKVRNASPAGLNG